MTGIFLDSTVHSGARCMINNRLITVYSMQFCKPFLSNLTHHLHYFKPSSCSTLNSVYLACRIQITIPISHTLQKPLQVDHLLMCQNSFPTIASGIPTLILILGRDSLRLQIRTMSTDHGLRCLSFPTLTFCILNVVAGPGRHHVPGRCYPAIPLEGAFRRPEDNDKELDVPD